MWFTKRITNERYYHTPYFTDYCLRITSICFSFIFSQHFDVNLNQTGESHLIILQDSITGLDIGDEVGIFDANGVLYTVESDETPEYGEVLVGAGFDITEEQLEKLILQKTPNI